MNEIYHGDTFQVLKTLPKESVDLILTSPPYYGLRDYGGQIGQIGQEKTPQEYISNLMKIFDECKRVLKKTGSIWINIGDSYVSQGSKKPGSTAKVGSTKIGVQKRTGIIDGISEKSLIGIPERFVIAMTDSGGWIRRNTIIWQKGNAMPSSAKDRFTVDFEYFYFFTKSKKYYFETQYEPLQSSSVGRMMRARGEKMKYVGSDVMQGLHQPRENLVKAYYKTLEYNGKATKEYEKNGVQNPSEIKKRILEKWKKEGMLRRNKRCVWTINTKPFKGAHFAVFPGTLLETPIKACCPPNGGVVLDPFMGSGTTAVVAKKLGRNWLGIELNEDYIKMAQRRINSLL